MVLRIEWNQIRSVIIQVINKIGRLHSGSPIYLIMSMITDHMMMMTQSSVTN